MTRTGYLEGKVERQNSCQEEVDVTIICCVFKINKILQNRVKNHKGTPGKNEVTPAHCF